MFLAENLIFNKVQTHIYKQKERTNRFITEMFSLFLLGDMLASKRDILTNPAWDL